MPGGSIQRVDVLGVGISAIDMGLALKEITNWIENRHQHYVCVTGVHGVMESVRDPELRRIHNASGLTTPDGMPMVWCAHVAGAKEVRRVPGADLMMAVCGMAAERGWSSYFYGGKPGVAEMLARRIESQLPEFLTAGFFSPPFGDISAEDDQEIVEMINKAAPDLLWVGLSTPKQERWMAQHVGRVEASVLLGVGAAFDINAGLVNRAPSWMQHSGLEWLFRLGTEPRRLWRRYLRNNPAFLGRILLKPPVVVNSDFSSGR